VRLGNAAGAGEQLLLAVRAALATRDRGGVATERLQYAESVAETIKYAILELAPLDARKSLEAWELLKGRSFMESLSIRDAMRASAVPETEIERRAALGDRLTAAAMELKALAGGGSAGGTASPATLKQLQDGKRAIEKALDALDTDLSLKYPRYDEFRAGTMPGIDSLAAVLVPGECALVYATIDYNVGAWLVSPSGRVQFFQLGNSPGLQNAVIAYRKALLDAVNGTLPPGSISAEEHLLSLAPRIVPPAEAFDVSVKSLVIIPDAILGLLPWEAIPFAGTRLGLRFSTSYAPSLSVLAKLRDPKRDYSGLKRVPLLAFGGAFYKKPGAVDPAFAANAGPDDSSSRTSALSEILSGGFKETVWENLPGTEREVDAIAGIYYPNPKDAGASLFKGIMASEPVVRKLGGPGLQVAGRTLRLADAKILHFACHGQAAADFPETSRIVLTQAAAVPAAQAAAFRSLAPVSALNDGSLLAAEIIGLTVKADLVVLSACETASGKVSATEGVIGLTQAWMTAGAGGVIVSLWPVSDDAACIFMIILHAQLAKGIPVRDAMRVARDQMASDAWFADPRWVPLLGSYARNSYADPFYYAAFQYWGK